MERKGRKLSRRFALWLMALLVAAACTFTGCSGTADGGSDADSAKAPRQQTEQQAETSSDTSAQTAVKDDISLSDIPAYSGSPYVEIDGNEPDFSASRLTTKEFETYGALDDQGRCTTAYVNVSEETMPTEERGSIGMIKPTGWHTIRYDFVDGKYLYNRCHLVAHELAGEDANEENLITGTRYLNIEGMLPFENEVADYVKSTGNHVIYEVTPVFKGSEQLARGVHMEAESVEDKGKGISFNIYCYNVQPGVHINYRNGDSYATGKEGGSESSSASSSASSSSSSAGSQKAGQRQTFILNTNTGKFHREGCYLARTIARKNRSTIKTTAAALERRGYSPCKRCNPR
ncbi:MAG: DNA/RNA non-specific endonuclease [Eubacteriales bacterium]|nr:DNA/RNA non-specific endonuclease [Eubacteriales bacterium]